MTDPSAPGPMRGGVIGITAARRATEQCRLVEALGGVPLVGSTLDLDRPEPDADLAAAIGELIRRPPDVVVFMTGIGARHVLGAAERLGVGAQLREALETGRLIARGGKARTALREVMREPDWTADPPEAATVRDALLAGPLTGIRVTVQCAGPDPEALLTPLRAAGAEVVELHPYAVRGPSDAEPGLRLVRAAATGRLAALTFTSAHAVDGFIELTERDGLDATALPSTVLVTAVGGVTAAALREAGVRVDVRPETPKMGAMFHALAAALERQAAGGTG